MSSLLVGHSVSVAPPVAEASTDPWTQRLVEAQQLAAVGQLAAGVAHEIGAPLTAIGVVVEYLLEDPTRLDEEARRDLGIVLAQTRRISGLARRLVGLAKPPEPVLSLLDLNSVVRHAFELLERPLRRDRIACELRLTEPLARVFGDDHQLQQVVLNLVLNAQRALLERPPSQRRLEVRTLERANHVELSVKDNGPGVDRADASRIFHPFFSRAGGTGLGLTLARAVVHQHGGTIELESSCTGAAFRVRLPRPAHERQA